METDEDVEIVSDSGCHYVQVKTRGKPLVFSDIEGAVRRDPEGTHIGLPEATIG